MRTHDGNGAFVIVDHDEEDAIQAKAPISNIYSAGFNSSLYTLSLRRNYRRGFVTDFGRIEGLPGALREVLSGSGVHVTFEMGCRPWRGAGNGAFSVGFRVAKPRQTYLI